ncbi:MAG: CHAT domain-containing protein [Bacteroidetes bacterium]|nr:CHAT domain-containing protein [Bacteroidota bacterium]
MAIRTILLSLILCTTTVTAIHSQNWEELNTKYNRSIMSGDYSGALEFAIKGLEKAEKQFARNAPEYGKSIENLAKVYIAMNNHDEALIYYDELMKLEFTRIEDSFPDFAATLNFFPGLLKQITKSEVATAVYEKAIERLRKIEEIDYAVVTDLTNIYTKGIMAQYQVEEPKTDDERISSVKNKYGYDSKEYIHLLDSLAKAYRDYAKFGPASDILQEVYDIRKKKNLTNTVEHATTCFYLGYVMTLRQKYDEAAPFYDEGLEIYRNNKFEKTGDYTDALYFRSIPYMFSREWQPARENYEEAIRIIEQKLGKDYIMYTGILLSLGSMCKQLEDYEAAEIYYNKENDYRIAKGDTGTATAFGYLMGMGPVYEKTKRWDKADEVNIKLSKATREMIDQSFQYVTIAAEKEVANRFVWFKFNLNSIYSYCYKRYEANPALAEEMYNNELIKKGIIMRAIKSKVAKVLNSGDTALVASFHKWIDIRQKLAKLYQLPVSERKENVVMLEREAQKCEQDMSYKIFTDSDKGSLMVDWKQVQKKLAPDEAAIEFLNFDYYNPDAGFWTDSVLYCALIVRPGYKTPKLVTLFEEKELSRFLEQNKGDNPFDQVRRLYTFFTGQYRKYYKGDSLYHYIWKPVHPYLEGVNKLYYSPSGLLHKISFSAIPVDKDNELIELYSMQHMSTTALLTHDRDPFEISEKYNALLYGGILYDLDPNSVGKAAKKFKVENEDYFIRDRSFDWSDSLRRGGSWSYLPGTKEEVLDIDSLFNKYNVSTQVHTGEQAVEESFKYAGVKMPEIIHIATHGFFFPEKKEVKKERFMNYTNTSTTELNPDEAMMRSGLLFAGANSTWKGITPPEGAEDGILTAYEVSKMNLTNTKLVVMSACETGLGDIKGGEGVYGLQRAFKLAGAEYIIMSLWQIPDEQTVELMNLFYGNWLKGEDIREAFYAAQKEMGLKYEPYFWAAFVLVE